MPPLPPAALLSSSASHSLGFSRSCEHLWIGHLVNESGPIANGRGHFANERGPVANGTGASGIGGGQFDNNRVHFDNKIVPLANGRGR